jgi:hypothetical protein
MALRTLFTADRHCDDDDVGSHDDADNAGYTWASMHDEPPREIFAGVRLYSLWEGGGAKAFVLQMDAGSGWPHRDVHDPGPEEVFVVSGVFNDGQRDYPEGSFIHAPAGSWHVPQTTTGCTLFLFYPEG